MSILLLFSKLKQMERETASLYLYVSQKIAHEHMGLSHLFEELADEEIIHEKQVELAKNIFLEAKNFNIKEDGIKILDDILKMVQYKRKYFMKNSDRMDSIDIIKIALDIETNMEEKHHGFYIKTEDKNLKALFQSLCTNDKAHAEKLKQFLQTK